MHLEMSDPDYWERYPERLKGVSDVSRALGLDGTSFIMGDPDDENAPAVAILKMPPNYLLTRHFHETERVEVVLFGTLDVGEGRILGPGAVMQLGPNVAYGPHIAGPEGCTTIEIFSKAYALSRLHNEGPDGEMMFVDVAKPGASEAMLKLLDDTVHARQA